MAEVSLDEAIRIARQQHAAGNLQQAEAIYRQVLQQQPNHPYILHALGILANQSGKPDAAADLIRHAIAIHPDEPSFHYDLGRTLRQRGQIAEAMAEYEVVTRLAPNHLDAKNDLGIALMETGRLDEAVNIFRKVIQLKPTCAAAYINLGSALRDAGRPAEAIVALSKAIELDPRSAAGYINLSAALKQVRRVREALDAANTAVQIDPKLAPAWNNLGTALLELSNPAKAAEAFRHALQLAGDHPVILNNLGNVLREQGEMDQAIASYRSALRRHPNFRECHSNLLLSLNYETHGDPESILREHIDWSRRHAEPLASEIQPHPNDVDPDRRLRIGFISRDFRHHPVGRFLLPMFAAHDREHFQIVCLSDVLAPDAVTDQLRAGADEWHDIGGMKDLAVADFVRGQNIDLLVDLAGHSASNRLLVFARKPAPVQATYLGYPNTTGMNAIDYRITDALADPPGRNDAFYTEKLVRLPHTAWCYHPPMHEVAPSAPPLLARGHVTFGSFNILAKVTPRTIEMWARILAAVPNAHLLLKASGLQELETKRRLIDAFGAHGIAMDRLDFREVTPTVEEHLRTYHEIDIALDTFPYNGTTTTCEALWMGVPVITLAGKAHASRVGLSLLTALGSPQWVAQTPEDYIHLAANLARDAAGLTELRATLRERMMQSPLMNATGFARDLEQAWRTIWRDWCESSRRL